MSIIDRVGPSIRSEIETRLDQHPAWPTREFKLEMELYELYQDTTGTAIDQSSSVVKMEIDGKPFYVQNGTSISSVKGTQPYLQKEKVDEFLQKSGNTANIAAYVAACQVYSEIEIGDMDLHPEGNFQSLLSTTRRPDMMVRFPNEYAPIEVYNGGDFINNRTDKHDQLIDLKSKKNRPADSNPILINRRSTERYKRAMMKKNITIADTDMIFTSESIYSDYRDTIQFFNLDDMVVRIPEIEAANGDKINGDDYDFSEDGPLSYDDGQRLDALLPHEDIASNSDKLPTEYLERVRGAIQLHYVNTLYRRIPDADGRAASLIIQNMYNDLLRSNTGVQQERAVDDGRKSAVDQYPWIKQLDPESVSDEVGRIIDGLVGEKILTRSSNNTLTARQAIHPQPTFST